MIISTKYLITGDGKTVLTDKAVYIGEDGKIGKIAPKEELLKEFPQEEVKEYGDATLLPGLMDMHAHLAYGYSQPDSFNYGAQLIMLYALQHAQAAFERGITTVRDMSSAHGVCKNPNPVTVGGVGGVGQYVYDYTDGIDFVLAFYDGYGIEPDSDGTVPASVMKSENPPVTQFIVKAKK